MKRFLFITTFSLFFRISSEAQQDTLLQDSIPLIEVKSPRWNFVKDEGIKIQDGIQNLGQALQNQTSIFVKNYGPSTLATPAMRGMASNHTAILWKGLNLQSITNGVFDLSLIPTIFIDKTVVDYGGASALWGSGAVAGSIHLLGKDVRQKAKAFSGIAQFTLGSFEDYRLEKKLHYHFNKGQTYLKWASFYHQAKNDFPYRDLASFGQPEKRLVNAESLQYGTLLEAGHRQGKWDYSTWLWWQQSERQIPPSMTEANANALQADEAVRFGLDATGVFSDKVLKIKAAWFSETIDYNSNVVDSHSEANTYFLESELDWRLNEKQRLNFGFILAPKTAEVANYNQIPRRTDAALFAAYRYQFHSKWQGNLSLRQAASTDGTNPTTFSLGFDYQIRPTWALSAQFNRDFKQPTFNDLYWDAPDGFSLLPETSWSQSLKLAYQEKQHRATIEIFNINLSNQILWSPQSGGIWRPDNITSVWSRGIHFSYQSTFKINNNSHLNTELQYQFVQSTNESEWFNSKGKQLIYTPNHTANLGLDYYWKAFHLRYGQQFTGRVYITRDNAKNSALTPYIIGQLSIAYKLGFLPINTTFAVNNLWGTEYQAIAWRPMPRRHFQLILKYHL